MMLTPEELRDLTAYHEACKGAAWRYESEILCSGGVSTPLSQHAHAAIAKLLERELRLQSPEFEERLHGVVQLATVDTALAVRGVLHAFDLVSRAPAAPPPNTIYVAIARDGHEGRTTKYLETLLGFCVCVHCAKLPDWERIIDQRVVQDNADTDGTKP